VQDLDGAEPFVDAGELDADVRVPAGHMITGVFHFSLPCEAVPTLAIQSAHEPEHLIFNAVRELALSMTCIVSNRFGRLRS
jgi:hypothetical protein